MVTTRLVRSTFKSRCQSRLTTVPPCMMALRRARVDVSEGARWFRTFALRFAWRLFLPSKFN